MVLRASFAKYLQTIGLAAAATALVGCGGSQARRPLMVDTPLVKFVPLDADEIAGIDTEEEAKPEPAPPPAKTQPPPAPPAPPPAPAPKK